jgi:cell division protein FtsW
MYGRQRVNQVGSFADKLKQIVISTKRAVFEKSLDLELGRRHRPKYLIVTLVATLAFLGMLVIFTISPGQNWQGNLADQNYFMLRQLIYLAAGIVAFIIASQINLNFLRRMVGVIIVLAFASCILLAIAGALHLSIAGDVNGANRWLYFGSISFQPAELMKFAVMLFTASFIMNANARGELNSVRKTLVPLCVITLLALAMVVGLQSDFSSGAVILALVVAQLIISGMRWRNIALGIAPFLAIGVIAVIFTSYRMSRLSTFMEGCVNADDQICRSLMALGSGGLFGEGLGQGTGGFGWVQEAINDGIFPIIGETFGYVGALVVLIIFAALLLRILSLADYLPNLFLRLIMAGAFGWVASQTIINIGAMTGVIPVTGITLPFLSFGGSSMVSVMFTMGLALSVSRYTNHQKIQLKTQGGDDYEDTLRRRGIGRTRYAGRRGY